MVCSVSTHTNTLLTVIITAIMKRTIYAYCDQWIHWYYSSCIIFVTNNFRPHISIFVFDYKHVRTVPSFYSLKPFEGWQQLRSLDAQTQWYVCRSIRLHVLYIYIFSSTSNVRPYRDGHRNLNSFSCITLRFNQFFSHTASASSFFLLQILLHFRQDSFSNYSFWGCQFHETSILLQYIFSLNIFEATLKLKINIERNFYISNSLFAFASFFVSYMYVCMYYFKRFKSFEYGQSILYIAILPYFYSLQAEWIYQPYSNRMATK